MRRTYQEERVGHEGVGEDGPAEPATTATKGARDGKIDNDANELVARVGNKVKPLRLVADAEHIRAELEKDQFDNDNGKGVRGCDTKQLGLERAPEAGHEGAEKNVRYKGHDRDVHVRRVDVFSRWQEERPTSARGTVRRRDARPRLVAPGEQHNAQLVDDIAVGHVEVVLQCRDGNVAVEL